MRTNLGETQGQKGPSQPELGSRPTVPQGLYSLSIVSYLVLSDQLALAAAQPIPYTALAEVTTALRSLNTRVLGSDLPGLLHSIPPPIAVQSLFFSPGIYFPVP